MHTPSQAQQTQLDVLIRRNCAEGTQIELRIAVIGACLPAKPSLAPAHAKIVFTSVVFEVGEPQEAPWKGVRKQYSSKRANPF